MRLIHIDEIRTELRAAVAAWCILSANLLIGALNDAYTHHVVSAVLGIPLVGLCLLMAWDSWHVLRRLP